MTAGPLAIIPLFLLLIVGLRIAADRMDRQRIRKDVAQRGGEVLDIRWSPFGRGWFTERSDHIYFVTWVDAERREHRSWCKTSLFTGVYWTEDPPQGPARGAQGGPGQGASDSAALRDENRRLREENERLRRSRS